MKTGKRILVFQFSLGGKGTSPNLTCKINKLFHTGYLSSRCNSIHLYSAFCLKIKKQSTSHLFPITSKSKKAQLFNITFPCKRVTKTIYHQTLSGSLLLRDLNSFSQYLFMSHKQYQGSVEIKQKSKPGAQPQCIIWSCYLRFSLRGALRNMHKVGHVGELWRAKSSNYRHRGWRPSASKFICCQYSQQIFLVSHQWQTCCSNPASVHLNFKSVFTT